MFQYSLKKFLKVTRFFINWNLLFLVEKFLSQQSYDMVLFSFHGLPEKYLKKHCGPGHCLIKANCCANFRVNAPDCYKAQCYETARCIAKLWQEKFQTPYTVAFQSRLGAGEWIKPYLEPEVESLANQGVKKLLVVCPSFVADCLETLEEVGLSIRQTFIDAGGETFTLVPCLNDDEHWVENIGKLLTADR